jgi:hypothetical protein
MRFAPAAILFGALALAACDDDDDNGTNPTPQNAQVKVVHAIANAGTVAVQIDNATPAITNFAFRQVQPSAAATYLPIPAGQRRIRVLTNNGAGTPAIDVTPTLAGNTNYTVIAAGSAGGSGTAQPAAILLVDTLTAPAAGQVRIRAVHAASAVAGVDIYASPAANVSFTAQSRLFANVPFRSSGAIAVPAGAYSICIIGAGQAPTSNGSNCAILASSPNLAAGTIATAIATDAAQGTGQTPQLVFTVDRAP